MSRDDIHLHYPIKPIPYPPKCAYVDEIADAIQPLGVQVVMRTHWSSRSVHS